MEEQRPGVPFGYRSRELCQDQGIFYCDSSTPFDVSRHRGGEMQIHHAEWERSPDPRDPNRVHLKCRNCEMSHYIPKGLADYLGL